MRSRGATGHQQLLPALRVRCGLTRLIRHGYCLVLISNASLSTFPPPKQRAFGRTFLNRQEAQPAVFQCL
jgi:hypothetical protein